MLTTMRWQTIQNCAYQIRRWNDEFVVYNTHSGDTHILDEQAADILFTLQAEASDMLSIMQVLARKWLCEMSPNLTNEIEAMLLDMQTLSLVERV